MVKVENISDNLVNISTVDAYHEIDLDQATGDVTVVVDSSDSSFTEGHQTFAKIVQGSALEILVFLLERIYHQLILMLVIYQLKHLMQ